MKFRDKIKTLDPSIKLIVLAVLIFLSVYSIWILAKYILLTENPVVYVASGSMYPTLKVGDLLFVRGVEPGELKKGDIIVFVKPVGNGEYIVHRIVDIKEVDGRILLTTKGDNNPSSWYWEKDFDSRYVVGKVFFWVRFIGFIPMVFQEMWVRLSIIAILIILIAYDILSELLMKRKNVKQQT
ncbi:MAG: signal peptidase I [Candidatus Bathyarchaeia archaeon]